jgi:hypothetical protein
VNRSKRIGLLGGLIAVVGAVVLAPFLWLWASLPPVAAVVLAVLLAGCAWLALRPPRWLLPDRHARRFGVGMAVALIAGFVLTTSRQELGDPHGSEGMVFYLLIGPILVILTGSAAPPRSAGRSARGCGPAPGPSCWARRC